MASAGRTFPFTFSIKQKEFWFNPSEISKGIF
jgi:hypothetical protein